MVDQVGPDVTRFVMLTRKNDAPLDFDFDKAVEQSKENPVFYVQYAHARTCRMVENAADLGMSLDDAVAGFDAGLLSHQREGDLLRALAEFPRVVTAAAELRAPHRVARYLEDTASVFNKWYDTKECRMLPQGDEPAGPVNHARLVLTVAARTVLANGLDLLGVSAPERM